ncbi:MAG: DUF3108 domain-containing protein [Chryseobacterium sp.]|nr:MAG: DUF3108 domain-containing protein [Chryseobacterium sp.]
MKKFFLMLVLLISTIGMAQPSNINSGEVLRYRVHYGIINAGTATLTATRTTYAGQPHLYVRGNGQTTGALKAFFRVNDIYESYINLNTGLPSFYVRNVSEGTYTQNLSAKFNQKANTVMLVDRKHPGAPIQNISIPARMQDMLSAFYYLRSLDPNQLRVGNVIRMNVWIDDNYFPFALRVAGTEVRETKFGKVNALKIVPTVLGGRVFKNNESVTMWVTNDINHVPVEIRAELRVGALTASLDSYAQLRAPIQFFR